jgi:glycosyltransferase involved in cell wall biosynthesis
MRTNPGIAILHRAWRAIPHAWRRRALDRAALWLAPGRERHPLEGEGWIVVGALSASTGLGEAARLAVQALVSLGRRVSVYDVSAAFRQDISVEPPALEPAEAGPGTVLMFVTPPLCALALWRIPRHILRGKRRIASWVWEFEEAPSGWRAHAELFDHITAPSRFAATAIGRAIGHPVGIVPYPVAVDPLPSPISRTRAFTVGFMADMTAAAERKNPAGVIEAFIRSGLKGDRGTLKLHLHDTARGAGPVDERIEAARRAGYEIHVTGGVHARAEARSFYRDLDLYVSLHRAEGFGLTVAEAMLAGVPVVATDWSSTAEFVDESVGYPVPCSLVPAPPSIDRGSAQRWADPDIDAASAMILSASRDAAGRRRRTGAAVERMRQRFSAQVFLDALSKQCLIAAPEASAANDPDA